jgi:hypothetical protein
MTARLTPSERLERALQLSAFVHGLAWESIKSADPVASVEEHGQTFIERLFGAQLAERFRSGRTTRG